MFFAQTELRFDINVGFAISKFCQSKIHYSTTHAKYIS